MRSQKEAERAERQNIKNLVLNYDLHDSSADQDGTDHQFYLNYFSHPNPNIRVAAPLGIDAHKTLAQGPNGEKHGPAHPHNATLHPLAKPNSDPKPIDKSGTSRSGQRARKLQLSDVDW